MSTSTDLASRQLRSETLDPDLVIHPFAPNWAFAVPRSFRDALDIVWDIRQQNKVRRETWTQGANYRFAAGDVLYDHPAPYQKELWIDALPYISIALSITTAQPALASAFAQGTVEFTVMRKREGSNGLHPTNKYQCTQAEFVDLLRTGIFQDKHHSTL